MKVVRKDDLFLCSTYTVYQHSQVGKLTTILFRIGIISTQKNLGIRPVDAGEKTFYTATLFERHDFQRVTSKSIFSGMNFLTI